MGSRLAYVGSTLSILKLFAANVWVMQSTLEEEQPERDERSERFYTSASELLFYDGRNNYMTFPQVQSAGLINLLYMSSR